MGDKKSNKKEESQNEQSSELEKANSNAEDQEKNEQGNGSDEAENAEVIENLPPELQGVMKMGLTMQRFSGPMPHPLASKLNEKHIDKILDISEKDNDRWFSDAQRDRFFTGFCILIGVGLFIFLTIFLVGNDTELFKEILKLLVTLAGGIGIGYGIKSYKDRE